MFFLLTFAESYYKQAMKKLFFFTALAALCVSVSSFAQDKQVFNHLALGPAIGDTGIGIELAMPITAHFQVRAGYAFTPGITVNTDLSSLKEHFSKSTTRDLSNVPITGFAFKGGDGKLLFDYYPWADKGFHLTAGAYIGGNKGLHGKVNLTSVLTKDEYGTLAIGPQGGPTISSDKDGFAYVDMITNPVMPYIGLGWGRAVDTKKLVKVVFDVGLAYWGSPKVQSYNYVSYYAGFDKEPKTVALTSASLQNKDKGALDMLAKMPICPMLKLAVFFNIF